MDLGLEGKTALVTGGSAGIGLAVAEELSREGVSVAICARREDVLQAAAEKLRSISRGKVVALRTDITDIAQIDDMVARTKAELGRIDILVNNAGNGTYKPFLDVTDEELVNGMVMNFFSMFRVSQRVVPVMVADGGGVIVNMAGISGSSVMDPPFFSTCTGPAKAAEMRFTKALAMEFGPANIRVNCVAPGRINAPERFERWTRAIPGKEVDARALQREWGQRISIADHRWGEIEEIARLTVFAASPACAFMNGSILIADGGETRD